MRNRCSFPGRTIPTHVGRTAARECQQGPWPDHPHARGENGQTCGIVSGLTRTIPTHVGRTVTGDRPPQDLAGPSPRTWGERQHVARRVAATSDHPHARGENAVDGLSCGRRSTDHPHARGENAAGRVRVRLRLGPSPRTWGELPSGTTAYRRIRTIPTHVGRTFLLAQVPRRRTDHPHARGENTHGPVAGTIGPGPSPRTWGEPAPSRSRARVSSDHPHARGENARQSDTDSRRERMSHADHPHARGENRTIVRQSPRQSGPSPRTWGERPAARVSMRQIPDHPHARGENCRIVSWARPGLGPSPRTWGERREQVGQDSR